MSLTYSKIEKVLAYVFFCFFTIQILSPSLNGKTIYLEVIIAILNPFFYKWIYSQKIKKEYFILLYGIMNFSIWGHFETSLKLLVTIFLVVYLYYLHDKDLWKMDKYLYLSIFFAIAQFIFLFINPEWSFNIGSNNIAKFVWGEYATASYSNYYTVFFMPRVSGLAREAGFMASLIIVYIFYKYIQNDQKKLNIKEKIFIGIGYILSFSKMSLIIIVVFIINKLKYFINYIPFLFILIFWTTFMCIFWIYNMEYLRDAINVTFLARFGSYLILIDTNLYQLLFGVGDKLLEINSYWVDFMASLGDVFSGLAYFIIYNGLVGTLIYFISLYFVGLSSTGLLILLLFTINVQLDTNQNFVIISYFIIFKYYCKNNAFCYKFLKENGEK